MNPFHNPSVAGSAKKESNRKHIVFLATLLALSLLIASTASAQTFKVLHEFNGAADGALPEAALFRDATGNLFGTTFAGGGVGEGTVFKIDSTNAEKVLFSFTAFVSGSSPASALIQDQS